MIDELKSYPWPGNIRELRNVIERAVILNNWRQAKPSAAQNLERYDYPHFEGSGVPAHTLRLGEDRMAH
jgi:DNA-binding NtrC family response regulator